MKNINNIISNQIKKINRKIIFTNAWKYIKKENYTKNIAFKKSWFEYKYNSGKLYKQNKHWINYYCYFYSNYFNIDIEDLYSEANQIFIDAYNRFQFNKISFTNYLKYELYKLLKYFCYKELRKKTKEKIMQNDLYNTMQIFDEIKLKNNIILNDIANKIIDFCFQPDFLNKLKPYLKINNQQISKIRAIENYFKKVYNYKRYKINQAIDNIKFLLKEELI